jgi:hypothetical protein
MIGMNADDEATSCEFPIDEILTASMRSSVWPEADIRPPIVDGFPNSIKAGDLGGMTADDIVRLAERELRDHDA